MCLLPDWRLLFLLSLQVTTFGLLGMFGLDGLAMSLPQPASWTEDKKWHVSACQNSLVRREMFEEDLT